tara:strand:+ start:995 stop:2056 length:1062 start_codon:yes stop_codon:yes gene_type:complete
MSQALCLARKGSGKTKPNPRVGCVIAEGSNIIGQGYHSIAGGMHAEIIALDEAGERARNADLYVTLEPCAHYGKTPPCIETIISAGIRRVFIAMEDPNPLVKGKGIALLRKNNIEVTTGILAEEAKEINLGFISRMTLGRPYIYSKIATSLDGRTSLINGESQWISSEESRKDVQIWRENSCAILTGIGTVNYDDPNLTVRHIPSKQQPLRVILDSNLNIELSSKILTQENVLLVYGEDPKNKLKLLIDSKVRTLCIPLNKKKINLHKLMEHLARIEINNLWVEAGPTLNGSLLELGLIDEIVTYMAPILLGGNANPMFNNPILKSIKNKIHLKLHDVRSVGCDLRMQSRVIK